MMLFALGRGAMNSRVSSHLYNDDNLYDFLVSLHSRTRLAAFGYGLAGLSVRHGREWRTAICGASRSIATPEACGVRIALKPPARASRPCWTYDEISRLRGAPRNAISSLVDTTKPKFVSGLSHVRVMAIRQARRATLVLTASTEFSSPARARDDEWRWNTCKARFVTSGGRVRAAGNTDISHLEGKAWCLLLAARRGGRSTFDVVQSWTYIALAIRPDAVPSWRGRPGPRAGVDDDDNATDGDLNHAYAVVTAHQRCPDERYAEVARRVSADISRRAIRRIDQHRVLLLGSVGPDFASHVEGNPSCDAALALGALALAFHANGWAGRAQDGDVLLAEARFGLFALPPEWLRMARDGAAVAPVVGQSDWFVYDIVRVLSKLVRGGSLSHLIMARIMQFFSGYISGHLSAWSRPIGSEISPHPVGAEVLAIARLMIAQRAGLTSPWSVPSTSTGGHQYDSVCALLAQQARVGVLSSRRRR